MSVGFDDDLKIAGAPTGLVRESVLISISQLTDSQHCVCVEMISGVSWIEAIACPCYGVATISRLLKIIGLFCKRAL